MKQWGTALLVGLWLIPVQAGAAPLNLDDEHLYLRQEQNLLSIYQWGGHRHRGWRRPVVYRQIENRTIITKGELPVTGERFLELIDREKAAPALIEKVRQEEKARFHWGLASLGSFALFGVGVGFSDAPPSSGRDLANGVAIAGLCAGLLSGIIWTDQVSRPLFTIEEAAEAIKSYNRLLDKRG